MKYFITDYSGRAIAIVFAYGEGAHPGYLLELLKIFAVILTKPNPLFLYLIIQMTGTNKYMKGVSKSYSRQLIKN